MRLIVLALLVGILTPALPASAGDDCVAQAVTVCALDEGSTVYNVNGVYRSDKWNTLASASGRAGETTLAARAGQGDHYDSLYYCQWTCTRAWNQRDATEANVSQGDPLTSGWVWVGQEEGFHYRNTPSATSYWEYHTTGAVVSRSVGGTRVDAGAGQTAWRGYGPGAPYATGCSTGAFARLDGRAVAEVPGAPCQQGPVDTRVPHMYGSCTTTAAGRVCGRLPDWPDDTALPFL